ncbi:gamma-aminobutyric acid receptor-associated protein-like 2 isoform X2 [Anarhichas minor]|uniref:gamma-aminobutyric acid receptor-associated protein-like 2 isoform X2 n=1 Tax=Anarhichas minor TaxID=65739 RepID=UPI003F73D7C2
MKWMFKEDHSLEHRCVESAKIRNKYPDRVPVIVEKVSGSQIVDIDKRKYLVPSDITVAQFMWIIRKRIQLPSEKAIFLFVDKTVPQSRTSQAPSGWMGSVGAQPIFRSLQRCSIGFKSGLWLGHSRTFTELSRSHSFVILAVCLGSLSCWKMNLHPSLRSRALWSRFSSRMSLYIAAFIFPSILTSLPVPATEEHPHSMMLPPCFTVGMVLAR